MFAATQSRLSVTRPGAWESPSIQLETHSEPSIFGINGPPSSPFISEKEQSRMAGQPWAAPPSDTNENTVDIGDTSAEAVWHEMFVEDKENMQGTTRTISHKATSQKVAPAKPKTTTTPQGVRSTPTEASMTIEQRRDSHDSDLMPLPSSTRETPRQGEHKPWPRRLSHYARPDKRRGRYDPDLMPPLPSSPDSSRQEEHARDGTHYPPHGHAAEGRSSNTRDKGDNARKEPASNASTSMVLKTFVTVFPSRPTPGARTKSAIRPLPRTDTPARFSDRSAAQSTLPAQPNRLVHVQHLSTPTFDLSANHIAMTTHPRSSEPCPPQPQREPREPVCFLPTIEPRTIAQWSHPRGSEPRSPQRKPVCFLDILEPRTIRFVLNGGEQGSGEVGSSTSNRGATREEDETQQMGVQPSKRLGHLPPAQSRWCREKGNPCTRQLLATGTVPPSDHHADDFRCDQYRPHFCPDRIRRSAILDRPDGRHSCLSERNSIVEWQWSPKFISYRTRSFAITCFDDARDQCCDRHYSAQAVERHSGGGVKAYAMLYIVEVFELTAPDAPFQPSQ
ncbi:uncharacterized protein MYCGRDRAFT_97727 [Zymoseptoria tritici IPO323]|uniref:Uncharacterized protein n=1 Tax=Zymoseptoria tritici (strain CBS 115943 / IPO323) TaxID=336722 RepID=F9XR67_ZYMTI|nr:uncharacterized protein MYCGRDRAFT_97727 [Zymoseptoria tritici IPO323]EGP82205.1 hypothetical protein MYCGRDRAFT_97727 [Zymoseptoria tritici IPO323]